MLLKQITTILSADHGVVSLVGDRIYPDVAPQDGEVPNIVIFAIAGTPETTMGGQSDYSDSRIQFDCRAFGRIEANEIREALKVALDKFSEIVNNVRIDATIPTSLTDDIDIAPGKQQRRIYISRIEFNFFHDTKEL